MTYGRLQPSRVVALVAFLESGFAQGVITTIAGTNFVFPSGPIRAVDAPVGRIGGVALDGKGNFYLSDYDNSLIMKVDTKGVLTVVAGNGIGSFSGDGGLATNASIAGPAGLALDKSGNLYIAANARIRKVTIDGIISTVAGNGNDAFSGDGGLATSAGLSSPNGIAVDEQGDVIIADTGHARIRRVTQTGIISTVAGSGIHGFSGDGGPATNASLGTPVGVAVDATGNLFIADSETDRIRKVTNAGTISTVAGDGNFGFGGDGGPATRAALFAPKAVAVDASGTLFIADTAGCRIRMVTPAGVITTIAGTGVRGFAGDGKLAVKAQLNLPLGIAVDSAGGLLVADSDNNRIRTITAAGVISTVAGNGNFSFAGDGTPAVSAVLSLPNAVALDRAGNLFIADLNTNRVRKVSPAGIISTVAGNGLPAFSGDGGIATNASLFRPQDVTVDALGNLFIADTNNHRIRKVRGCPNRS